MAEIPKPHWYRFTPDRLIVGLLAVEVLLWLSDRLGWPVWHKGYAVLTAVAAVGVAMLVMLVWFAASLIFRWRFQFSIRSLLVLVLVVAIPSSWMRVEIELARRQSEAVKGIWHVAEAVDYDWQVVVGPAWLWNLLGNDFFMNVNGVHIIDNTVMDAGLEHLGGLGQLQVLTLSGTKVTDAGLVHLDELTQLKTLRLWGTNVTDAGLVHLKRLTKLQSLDVGGNAVTDAGLPYLAELSQLQTLYLWNTEVTDEGVRKLRQVLPNCKVTCWPPTPDERQGRATPNQPGG
jgi:hypothetical protein